jgi:hypothetical protein
MHTNDDDDEDDDDDDDGDNNNNNNNNNNYYSVSLVCKQTIPTARPPLVGEVSANVCGERGVTWSVGRIPMAVFLGFLTGAATFFSK